MWSSTCSEVLYTATFAGMTDVEFNPFRGSVYRGLFQPPIREYFLDRAVGLHFAQRCVDLVEHRLVALANGDADAADQHRFVVFREPRFRISALGDLVSDDRVIGEPTLDAADVHVANDVRNRIVDLDLLEEAGIRQRLHVGGADLRTDNLAFEILHGLVVLRVPRRHDQAVTIRIDRIAEVD